ncbi:MAG: WhiB family transcriptional regulator [Mycobacterium sp.]
MCQYEDVDNWFNPSQRARREAKAICTNCPIIASCAQRALDLDATHGVWASVVLPGVRDGEALEAARQRLRQVIDHYRHQPAELRQRSLRIRQAVHFAATQRERRGRTPGHGQPVTPAMQTEKASA